MIPPSTFLEALLRLNDLEPDFSTWLLLPGMGFGEKEMWWRAGTRKFPHEGIDLLFFQDHSGVQHRLALGTLLPAPWDGKVVAVFADFLGSTLLIRHATLNEQGWQLHSLLGHTTPLLGVGDTAVAGQPVAKVATPPANQPTVPPGHLHLSLAWLHPGCKPSSLAWPTITTNPQIRLIDPLRLAERFLSKNSIR